MSAPFELRAAELGDAGELARLAAELGYPASAAQMTARLEALRGDPRELVLVAARGAGLLGWIAARRGLSLEAGERVELVGLVVGADARRLGVGRALVAAAERWAAAAGVATVVVRSNVARAESHPFYERLGYARAKTQHVYAKRPEVGRDG